MTAVRDLPDIHTVLYLVSASDHLSDAARLYTAHRMCLLYTAVAKEWSAALYCDQQGSDMFLDLAPEFWLQYQPPARPRKTQRRALRT
jgi:hypothetical protein